MPDTDDMETNGLMLKETKPAKVAVPARGARTGPAPTSKVDPTASDFSSAIYKAITKVFANKNPTQMFCLNWPGTVLDPDHLGWDPSEETAGLMPERALIRTSRLLDQYIPPAPITQPDGTRVSDRYRQAIGQLGPRPDIDLIRLQEIIRKKLQGTVTVTINDKEVTMRLVEYFDYLQQQWLRARQQWGKLQAEKRREFRAANPLDPNRAWDQYLEWYATNAESYILEINSKYDELVAEFPLTAWQDAIAVLDTSDDGGLNEAKQLIRNSMIPVPYQEGGSYYPTTGVPYNWPQQIKPSTKYVDLLADPEAQQQALTVARSQLEQEIQSWMSIIPMVDDAAVRDDALAFEKAGKEFGKAQSDLLGIYGKNAVTAVECVADIMESRGKVLKDTPAGEQQEVTNEVNGLLSNLDKSAGKTPGSIDWATIELVAKKIADGNQSLIFTQQALIDSGRDLAGAANKFLQGEAKRIKFAWLEPYIKQLESKLEDVARKESLFAASANVYYNYLNSPENLEYKEKNPNADLNETNEFGTNAFPSKLSYPPVSTWTQIQVAINSTQLKSEKRLHTYFDQMQWGVNLFLASAGGSDEVMGTEFADKYMKGSEEIQIGFLATKVLIDRPWMKPEIFSHSSKFFRTMDKPLSPKNQMTHETLMGDGGESELLRLLRENAFPAYPVAALLVKDVTIKIKIDEAESQALRETEKSVKSQGGGFLVFSVSRSEAASTEEESMSSYVMSGQMIARAPAPQIVGYWTQFLPPDESVVINEQVATDIAQAIGFAGNLNDVHSTPREQAKTPSRGDFDKG